MVTDDMDMDDEREAASRARSAQLLERTEPTPEELAEQAERSRRNKLARIMAPSAPGPYRLPPKSEPAALPAQNLPRVDGLMAKLKLS
jgi:hypothetical protein